MTIEHCCPTCTPDASRLVAAPESSRAPSRHAAGSLTFTCRCGSAATVATAPGPGRELARLGWTVKFVES
jgi:hypothetical protein